MQLPLIGEEDFQANVRLDRMLVSAGFTASRSEAKRFILQKAVLIKDDKEPWTKLQVKDYYMADIPMGRPFYLMIGRKIKKVVCVEE